MAGERSKKGSDSGAFGFYLACFIVFLVLLGAAVLLLPVWRDYKSKEKELARLKTEIEKLKAERNEKLEKIEERLYHLENPKIKCGFETIKNND